MKRAEDISILITDKKFQKILIEWKSFTEKRKDDICREYDLSIEEVENLQQLWYGLDFRPYEISPSIIETALNEVNHRLFNKKTHIQKKSLTKIIFNQFAKVAAILILPILTYTSYLQFYNSDHNSENQSIQMVTVHSKEGTVTNMSLPDGSRVWLNAGSSVSYPTIFKGNTRNVSMTGEAYFEVVKNEKTPMNVSTGSINIKVYGTDFNINAFTSELKKSIEVTLIKGSVSLSSHLGKFNGENEFFIKPGQTISFNEDSRKLDIKNDDTFYYTAWKDGILIFKNTSFANVLERLSREFNVDIELNDKKLASVPMDATFRNENIDEILRLLSLSTPFRYHFETPQKLPDGTFVKTKIYIEKK